MSRMSQFYEWCESHETSEAIASALWLVASDEDELFDSEHKEFNRVWATPTDADVYDVLCEAWEIAATDTLQWGCESFQRPEVRM